MSSSREYLDMDSSKSASSIKFKASSGFFVNRWLAAILFLLFIGSLVAVGLLVYFLAPIRGGRSTLAPSADPAANLHGDGEADGSSSSAKKLTDVLLPTHLTPIHYELTLKPFLPPGNFSFAGSVQVHVRCVRATSDIYLHSHNISVHEATVRVVGHKGALDIDRMRYDEERQFFIIILKQSLESGFTYNVSMDFLGLLNDDMAGFYRSYYNDENGEKKWMAVTQFQPTDARRAFPCFDEPGLKATFDVTLMRPMTNHVTSLSNMPILRTEDRDENWKADIYERTFNMSTYLLAFVISEFESQTRNSRSTKFRVWARPEAMNQADYALDAGPKALDFFQDYFNISFPLPKQDMIAIPDFRAGAMENWGLITYRESSLLFDRAISSVMNKQRVLTVIVHELAHQWFGNLVTPKWWDDLWLNEGFATFMEYVGADHVEPTWNMQDQFISNELHDILELDSLETSHAISLPVNHPDEINEIFDLISYNKGAAIIRMMMHYLGESTFRRGLTNYLTEFSFRNAAQDDLWHYLTETSKEDGTNINVKEVMDSWTLQVGYPVVKVERDYAKKTATVTQKRFLMVPKNRTGSDAIKEKWNIPVSYTTSVEKNFTRTSPHFWIYKNNESIILSNDKGANVPNENEWMLFNIGETYYYRVNYDVTNWNLLSKQLVTNYKVIPHINRAQILDDAFDLARAKELDYLLAFNLSQYLVNETDYIPWNAATTNFDFIDKMLRFTASYGHWKRYLGKLVTPLYERLGYSDIPADTQLDKLARTIGISWACHTGNKDCKTKATSLFKEWMKNPESAQISPNIKQAVICNAIKEGGEEEWNFAFEQYKKSNVGSEKALLLRTLGCSEQSWILSRYLAMSINSSSDIRKSDAASVFSCVSSSSSIGRFLAFDFLRDRWSIIKEMHGNAFGAIGNMVKTVTSSFNTPFELQQLKEFIKEHKNDLGTATRALHQCYEETQANVMWMKSNYEAIESWLKQNVV